MSVEKETCPLYLSLPKEFFEKPLSHLQASEALKCVPDLKLGRVFF